MNPKHLRWLAEAMAMAGLRHPGRESGPPAAVVLSVIVIALGEVADRIEREEMKDQLKQATSPG